MNHDVNSEYIYCTTGYGTALLSFLFFFSTVEEVQICAQDFVSIAKEFVTNTKEMSCDCEEICITMPSNY